MTSRSTSIKAVFFDLDDTLFDHLYSTRAGLLAVCAAYPALQQRPIDVLFADYTRLLDEVHVRVLTGELTIDEARRERFRHFFLLHAPEAADLPAVIEHAAILHREHYQASRQAVVGAAALLEHLRQQSLKIVVVTNNLVEEQIDKLRHLKLEHLVDELVTSEEVGFIKPDPRIFQAALERSGCRAEEVVMVGDSWKADVLGARQAGIRAIWFNRGGLACPNPALALELRALEPLASAAAAILSAAISAS
ncbi:MAG TPA: HAD family hydrolase [Ktedonobacteraceae bacterium]|nr:HAD family hydrolase [Ktedonobacteraceae bacterium]